MGSQAGPAADAQDRSAAFLPGPEDQRAASADRIYPYLLWHLAIERPDQVGCADVTYIPMRRGFLYLAIMEWFSRKGADLAVVEHDGCRLLCCRSPRGDRPPWHA